MIEEPINTALNSSTWTAIALDGDTVVSSYFFQTRDSSEFLLKKESDSTNYFTFDTGKGFVVNFSQAIQPTVLFYAKSTTGTPVMEVFILNQNN